MIEIPSKTGWMRLCIKHLYNAMKAANRAQEKGLKLPTLSTKIDASIAQAERDYAKAKGG